MQVKLFVLFSFFSNVFFWWDDFLGGDKVGRFLWSGKLCNDALPLKVWQRNILDFY